MLYEGVIYALNPLIILKVLLVNILPKNKKDIPNKYYNYFSYVEILFAITILILYPILKKKISNSDSINNPNKEEKEKLEKHAKQFFFISLIPIMIELIFFILSLSNIIKIFPNDK